MQLKYPVTWNGASVSELTFKRAKGKDIKKINKKYDEGDHYAAGLYSLSLLTGISLEIFDEMDGQDIADAMGEMKSFLPQLPKEDDG